MIDSCVSDTEFCAFDLETTGLSAFSKIVEIGAVRFPFGGDAVTFSTFVNPGQGIPAEATAVHGITDSMVAGAPSAAEALPGLVDFSEGCVMLAHFARFDVGVLSLEMARSACPFPSNPVIDTVDVARRFLPGLRNYKLGTLTSQLGLESRGLHRALADALAVRGVFEAAMRGVDCSCFTVGELTRIATMLNIGNSVVADVALPRGFEWIQPLIENQARVKVVYDGGTKGRSPRCLTPITFYERKGATYMEAYCHTDGISKSFRVDRIIHIEEWEE